MSFYIASNNTVGGTVTGAPNIIAYSSDDGVEVDGGTGDAIRENSIHDSGNLGIELVSNGNNNQPTPDLTSAVTNSSGITIQGTLVAAANTSYALDFFANRTANPSGFGEGQLFLGSYTVTTDSSGTANFSVTFSIPVPVGEAISATATDPSGNTSAFAQDVFVSSSSDPNSLSGSSSTGASGAAASMASLAPSVAALTMGPAIASVGDIQNPLSTLAGIGWQPAGSLAGWTPFSSAVTAWSPPAANAGRTDLSASQSLDLFFVSGLVDDLLS